mmetsp:Transcript_69421/g.174975  ORF Transcript_69421/g.174975 Transcript_69421/m.174975 type:complete len:210 (-) Transcript_69421:44-673(-)
MPCDNDLGDVPEEEEALLAPGDRISSPWPGNYADAPPSGSKGLSKGLHGASRLPWPLSMLSWSSIALGSLLALLYIIIWTLPAPSFPAKLRLLQQSWHLSDVLQEPPKLKKRLEVAQKEVDDLKSEVSLAKSKADALQQRFDLAEKEPRELRKQLADLRSETAALREKKDIFQKRLDQEKTKEDDLEDKLSKLKAVELPLLNSIPDAET